MQNIKLLLRTKYQLPLNDFLCGSFIRDTEGSGISQGIYLPKLEKGPDLLCDYLEKLNQSRKDLHVVLAGWRRQYVISRLEKSKIPYSYYEMPTQPILNELYQCLDLYPITARHEGGPQSLIECGLLDIPVISRDIGMASAVLTRAAISDNVYEATPCVPDIENLKLPFGYIPYRDLISSL